MPCATPDSDKAGLLGWVSAHKKTIMLLLGAALVIVGLLICALHFTAPTGRLRQARAGALGIKWARHSHFALGAVLVALGAFAIVAGQVLQGIALMVALGLLAATVLVGSATLFLVHEYRSAKAAERLEMDRAICEAKAKAGVKPPKDADFLEVMGWVHSGWLAKRVGGKTYLVSFSPPAGEGKSPEYFEVNLELGTVRTLSDHPELRRRYDDMIREHSKGVP